MGVKDIDVGEKSAIKVSLLYGVSPCIIKKIDFIIN